MNAIMTPTDDDNNGDDDDGDNEGDDDDHDIGENKLITQTVISKFPRFKIYK